MAERTKIKNKLKRLSSHDEVGSADLGIKTGSDSNKRQKRTSKGTGIKLNKVRKDEVLSPSSDVKNDVRTKSQKEKNQRKIPQVDSKKEKKKKSKNGKSEGDNDKDSTCAKFVGAHCSIAGGVSNAVAEAVSLGARAFGLFVRNGRTWKLSPLAKEEASKFKELCKENNFLPHLILPHGSYLLNCGSSNLETLKKSRETLIHELQRCEMLGLTLYNFHPGSACGDGTVEECIDTIAESINLAHTQTKVVKTVIENMSCQGSTVGGKFEELKSIIDKVHDKSRIGVCLDTCHSFAAGFDLSTKDGFMKFMDDFDKKVGMKYLCAMHLNDSKGVIGCHLDRHENIGKGHIGLQGFSHIMKDPRLNNIPMILETPPDDYAKEITLLYSLT